MLWNLYTIILAFLFGRNFCSDEVVEYEMNTKEPLIWTEANLKVLSFRILPNWIDLTIEYNQSLGIEAIQWFSVGFGDTEMLCTYAVVFEPQLNDSNQIISRVAVTERVLGKIDEGDKLTSTFTYIEIGMREDPQVIVQMRLIRERVISWNSLAPILDNNGSQGNESNFSCPNSYYDFGFDGKNISVIYAKGINGDLTLKNHQSTNRGSGQISFIARNASEIGITCPSENSLLNETFAQRFDTPNVVRICQSCDLQRGCTIVGHDNDDNNICGCSNLASVNTSVLFLIDGAGYQSNSTWYNFTWKILHGFVKKILPNSNLEANIIIYGGSGYPLRVYNLNDEYVQSIVNNPIPPNEAHYSNLCNATYFGIKYLKSRNAISKILVTIPRGTPSDELECIIYNEELFNGIHSFTTKVLATTDLSSIELNYGGYNNCTYLYQSTSELEVDKSKQWPYVLAAISDYICVKSQALFSEPMAYNFPMELLMTSILTYDNLLHNFTEDIGLLIDLSYETASTGIFEQDRDFIVLVHSITNYNESEKNEARKENDQQTILILVNVYCNNTAVKTVLERMSWDQFFYDCLNYFFNEYFQNYTDVNDTVQITVHTVNSEHIGPTTTTTAVSTEDTSTTTTATTTTTTIISSEDENKSKFEPWMIAAIVIAIIAVGIVVFFLIRWMKTPKERINDNEESVDLKYSQQDGSGQLEEVAMITTGGPRQQRTTRRLEEDDSSSDDF